MPLVTVGRFLAAAFLVLLLTQPAEASTSGQEPEDETADTEQTEDSNEQEEDASPDEAEPASEDADAEASEQEDASDTSEEAATSEAVADEEPLSENGDVAVARDASIVQEPIDWLNLDPATSRPMAESEWLESEADSGDEATGEEGEEPVTAPDEGEPESASKENPDEEDEKDDNG